MSEHPRTDPNVHIPASVRRNAARAEQLIREQRGEPEPKPKDGQGVEGEQGNQQENQPGEQPRGENGQFTTQGNGANESQQGEQPPAQADTAPTGQGNDTWEQRAKSAEGRYRNAQNQIRQLSDQVSNMQRVMATLQSAPAPRPAQPASAKPRGEQTFERLVTPKDEEDYGADLLNVVAKRAKEVFREERQELEERIEQLQAQLGNVNTSVALDARSRMNAALDADPQIGENGRYWRELNEDPNFLSWLRLPDPYSGDIRHNLLMRAYEQNETARVAQFFKGFLTEEAAVDPARGQPHPQPGVTPKGNNPAPRVPLENLAAPGRAKSGAQAPAEKPIITRAQISEFYALTSSGKFKGTKAEQDAFEREIFAAQNEGRIRG